MPSAKAMTVSPPLTAWVPASTSKLADPPVAGDSVPPMPGFLAQTTGPFIGGGKIVAQGSKEELLSVPGSVVASLDDVALATALERGGFEVSRHAGGGVASSA